MAGCRAARESEHRHHQPSIDTSNTQPLNTRLTATDFVRGDDDTVTSQPTRLLRCAVALALLGVADRKTFLTIAGTLCGPRFIRGSQARDQQETMAEPLYTPYRRPRSRRAEWHRRGAAGARRARLGPAASSPCFLHADRDRRHERRRARARERAGGARRRLSSRNQPRAGKGALQAEPRFDTILIDAASDIARWRRVVAAGWAAPAQSDGRAAAIDDAGAKGFLALPAEPGPVEAIATEPVDNSCELVFEEWRCRQLLAVARQIAPADASVLITGESGTGKEMLARYAASAQPTEASGAGGIGKLRRDSGKSPGNPGCSATRKGRSPGPWYACVGKFEEADGSTLLLDEISEMHPRLQAKLLRATKSARSTGWAARHRSRSTSA